MRPKKPVCLFFDKLSTNGEWPSFRSARAVAGQMTDWTFFSKQSAASDYVSRAPEDSAKIGTRLWNLAQAVVIMRSIAVER